MASVGNQVYNGTLQINGNTVLNASDSLSSITLNKGISGSGLITGGSNSTNSIYIYGTQATLPTITYSNVEGTQGSIGSQIFFNNFNVFAVFAANRLSRGSGYTPVMPNYTTNYNVQFTRLRAGPLFARILEYTEFEYIEPGTVASMYGWLARLR